MDASAQISNAYKTYLGRDASQDEINYKLGDVAKYGLNRSLSIIQNSPEAGIFKTKPAAPAAPAGPTAQQLYDQQVASDNTSRQALIDKQNTEQQGLFNTYTNKINNQEALPALYSRLQTEARIPDLSKQAQTYKDQIYKVKDTLDRLGEDVTARTTGYNVSDAQRRRLETAEADPLQTTLSRLGTGLAPVADMLTSAQSGVQNQLGLYQAQQQKELQPIELQINSLSDRFAREITGYQQSHQETLDNLLQKLQRDQQLSDREWQAAQDLAAEERAYSRQKSLAASQFSGYSTDTTSSPAAPAQTSAPSVGVSAYLNAGKAHQVPLQQALQSQIPGNGISIPGLKFGY